MDHIPKDPLRHSQVQAIHTWPAMTAGSATSSGVQLVAGMEDVAMLGSFFVFLFLNLFIDKTVVWRPSCTCAEKFQVMFRLTSLIFAYLLMEAESAIDSDSLTATAQLTHADSAQV